MKKIDAKYIRRFNPCESGIVNFETKYPNFYGTLEELLKLEDISYSDKIWLTCKIVDYKILQQWSIDCAELVLENYEKKYPDDNRISECLRITREYLNGDATLGELSAARSAAWSAESAESAAWSAESAESAARSAAWSAARSAAWSAESAARSAARSAESAESAARSAAWSAESAESAAWSAEKEQEDMNLSLLIALICKEF